MFDKPERAVDRVFIHCSASSRVSHDNIRTIREWHMDRGFDDVGYHYFIRSDGTIEDGRDLEKIPAAQAGLNTGTIAICLHGLKLRDFTWQQKESLFDLCAAIHNAYIDDGLVTFHGHCEVSEKACPVIDYDSILGLNHLGYMAPIDRYRPSHTIEIFSRGSQVESLQRSLNMYLAERLEKTKFLMVDGIFGQMTQLTLMQFQKERGLEPDGIVGPQTRLVLPSGKLAPGSQQTST